MNSLPQCVSPAAFRSGHSVGSVTYIPARCGGIDRNLRDARKVVAVVSAFRGVLIGAE
jgi:hypothetical protein